MTKCLSSFVGACLLFMYLGLLAALYLKEQDKRCYTKTKMNAHKVV